MVGFGECVGIRGGAEREAMRDTEYKVSEHEVFCKVERECKQAKRI